MTQRTACSTLVAGVEHIDSRKMWRNPIYRSPSVGSVRSSVTLHYKWDLPLCCRTLGRQAGGWCWRVELLWATVDIWCSGMNRKCWRLWSGAAWPWRTSCFVADWSCPPWWNTLFSQLSSKNMTVLWNVINLYYHKHQYTGSICLTLFWTMLFGFSADRFQWPKDGWSLPGLELMLSTLAGGWIYVGQTGRYSN